MPPLQFSEVDDDDTLSGSQPDNIFNNGSQVTQGNLNEDNNMQTEGQREELKEIIDRSNNDGDMTRLRSDLEEFAKEGNLQPSNAICGCRLGGNDHDKENPSSANNEEDEKDNLLLTILKIGHVNVMIVDPNDADIILNNFKSSDKKQSFVQSDKKILIEPKASDGQLSTDQNNDLRELAKKHNAKGPRRFQK